MFQSSIAAGRGSFALADYSTLLAALVMSLASLMTFMKPPLGATFLDTSTALTSADFIGGARPAAPSNATPEPPAFQEVSAGSPGASSSLA